MLKREETGMLKVEETVIANFQSFSESICYTFCYIDPFCQRREEEIKALQSSLNSKTRLFRMVEKCGCFLCLSLSFMLLLLVF